MVLGRKGQITGIAACVVAILSGCGHARFAREVDAGGQCVPVVCPVGDVDTEGQPVAARMDGENVELLVEGLQHAEVVGTSGVRYEIQLPNESPIHEVNGGVALTIPNDWLLQRGLAVGDGFVLLLQGPPHNFPSCIPHPDNGVSFSLWRVEHGVVTWRHDFNASSSMMFEPDVQLSASGDELALAYEVDEPGSARERLVVDRRALATGVVLSSTDVGFAHYWRRTSIQYTPKALLLAWSPEARLLGGAMYIGELGGSSTLMQHSRRNTAVTLTPSGGVVVQRSSPGLDRLLLNDEPLAYLETRISNRGNTIAIETDRGTAVAFGVGAFEGRGGIVGDSGITLWFDVQRWETERAIVPLDAQRLLLIEGSSSKTLSILTCAESHAAAGRACETPDAVVDYLEVDRGQGEKT